MCLGGRCWRVPSHSLEDLVTYVMRGALEPEEIGGERLALRFVQWFQGDLSSVGGVVLLDGIDDPPTRVGTAVTKDEDEEDPVFFHQAEKGFDEFHASRILQWSHSLQNLALSAFSYWQLGHFISIVHQEVCPVTCLKERLSIYEAEKN